MRARFLHKLKGINPTGRLERSKPLANIFTSVVTRAGVMALTEEEESKTSSLRRRLTLVEGPKNEPTTAFFQRGRELESVYDNHRYTDEERHALAEFDSLDYLPPHSQVYKEWLRKQPRRLDWDRWIMMGLIGFSVGFVGFLLHQCIDVLSDVKFDKADDFVQDSEFFYAWGWLVLWGIGLVLFGSAIVVLLRPSAAASGLPELIGFLNGTIIRRIFSVKTFIVKFFSCMAAVASGLPVGPEGPMIHMGSLIGAGLSQMRSSTLRFSLPLFNRFRNSEDRRNFISAGAGAGIASAFGAPVGGMLFSMEEVSSFWNQKLTWQIFFCCMISTFTTDLFNSAFIGWKYDGPFGLFKTDRYILFRVEQGIALHLLVFIPTIIIGVIGGILGSLFTFMNVKIARWRRSLLKKVESPCGKATLKMIEPVIIIVLMVTVTVFLPQAFSCTKFECNYNCTQVQCSVPKNLSPRCLNSPSTTPLHTESNVYYYTCPKGIFFNVNGSIVSNGSFSEVATLLFVTGEEAIKHLFSRQTQLEFGAASLITVLIIYFILSCWTAGTFISSGLVVPMLFIGALYGRLVGVAMVAMFGVFSKETLLWAWIDPGAFALIGAASFFGGVSRLTVSLTVIMLEITNDVQFLLPIMVAIMVAKWTGDFITHPIYHALLEMKCIPFLDAEPVIIRADKKTTSTGVVNLELHCASDAMTKAVKVLPVRISVYQLANTLMSTTHGGYPVIERAKDTDVEVFGGIISRDHLLFLLLNASELMKTKSNLDEELQTAELPIDMKQLVFSQAHPIQVSKALMETYATDEQYKNLYFDLSPFINRSNPTVSTTFSLHRTYILFRTLGLRHLVVLDECNRVAGILTRKDLMGFALEERLVDVASPENEGADSNAEPTPVELQQVAIN
ncbi:chloride channel protein C-like [Oscarella lobularis]|uniref:chloride channel protein C-like n=1 Tax=Oscarella lobularis TaxID=121494 RepID=UPI0033138535